MKSKNKQFMWMVLLIATLMTIPFLWITDFNTKGEPREAIVAVSMLNEGNWILPVNNGGDIAYKPPFFHWCIALFSLPFGEVSIFTARLPSALSMISVAVFTFSFFVRRTDCRTAFLTAIMTITSLEVMRASINCRVDMVLTACIVIAIYKLYDWYEGGLRGLPLVAILCMSAGTLTKGPVAIVLPSLIIGLYALTRKVQRWRTCLLTLLTALLSCVLPTLWYYAAYCQGGQTFLSLVMEENLGRFMGSMSYDSHLHPFYYNFSIMALGFCPWTLFILPLFCDLYRRHLSLFVHQSLYHFTWISLLTVFVFYCIPSSKRGVYLLPCYPFAAFLMATYIRKYFNEHPRLTDFAHTYGRRIIVSIAVLYIVAHAVVIPMILNKKSDKPLAENIQKEFGNTPLYGYISTDMLRFFGTNFYLDDRIGQFEVSKPDHGILMIAKGDCEGFMKKHEKTYKFYFASQTNRRMTEMRDTIQFYRFKRLSTK